MSELAFPIAALALTFFVLIPAMSLMSWAVLKYKRARTAHWVDFGDHATLAWLIAPTLLPLAWLGSSALHQGEPARALEACLIEHSVLLATCLEALVILAALTVATLGVSGFKALQTHPRNLGDGLPKDDLRVQKVDAIIAGNPLLRAFPIKVICQAPAAVFTHGWWRPRFYVDACFVADNDAEILHAALLHELGHARARDPLRVFAARICLMLNPLSRLLEADFERWRNAREGSCDAEAVRLGGDPLSLAQGIVRAARFRCLDINTCGIAMLCGHDATLLRLRVAILMEGARMPRRTFGHVALGFALLVAVMVPHLFDTDALQYFHHAVERFFLGAA